MSDVEYVVNFGSDKSIQFVKLSMAEVEHHGARLGKPIVRCRDCIYYKPYKTYRHGTMNRCYDENGNTHRRDDSDFCSRGERRVDA